MPLAGRWMRGVRLVPWTVLARGQVRSKDCFHLVFESHTGRAAVPIPKRSASPRVISTPQWWIGLKALDQNRPIREGTRGYGKGPVPGISAVPESNKQAH